MSAFRRTRFAGLLCVTAVASAAAQDPAAIARFVPPGPDPAHVFVMDSAHILSAGTIAALQDSARSLQTETHADVAWVTLPTLGGRPIEQAALYIGRTWRIGNAGQPGDPLRNRGLVVLYVPDKTKTAGPNFRIEVGNGLEGTITDSRSRQISAAMREDLRAKHFDAAYLKGWEVAARLVREDYAAASSAPAAPVYSPPPAPAQKSSFFAEHLGVVFFAGFGGLLLVLLMIRRARSGPRSRTMAFYPATDFEQHRIGFRDRHHHNYSTVDDDEQRRRAAPPPSESSFWSGSSDSSSSSSSSDGGSFGDGGGFSGGGSSDTI